MDKKLFAKQAQQNEQQPEYWYKKGYIYFTNHAQKTNLTQGKLNFLSLDLMSEAQIEQLLQHLQQDWGFSQTRQVRLSPVDRQAEVLVGEDIGQRVLWLIGLSVVIFIAGFILLAMGTHGLHLGVESYVWMLPLTTIPAIAGYYFIKAEGKAYVLASACCMSLILGPSSYFFALQLNRVFSEQWSTNLTTQMTLVSIDEYSQMWQLSPGLQKTTGLDVIYVHKTWQGYNDQLQPGKSYTVHVKKGAFKDYFLDQESFAHVEEANVF